MNLLLHGIRRCSREPVFTLTIAAISALGISATTLVFSVVDAAVFRPPPYERHEELALIRVPRVENGERFFTESLRRDSLLAWQEEASVFADVQPYGLERAQLNGDTEGVLVGRVGPGLPRLLGFAPVVGRVFAADDAGAKVALVSEDYARVRQWPSGVLNGTVEINREKYAIVGVMPDAFSFPRKGVQVWFPIAANFQSSSAVGRIADGLTLPIARQAVELINARQSSSRLQAIDLAGLNEGISEVVARSLWMLSAAVCCLQLISAVNVAGLLWSRLAKRQNEMAIRSSLGATRLRILAQCAVEGAIPCVFGGALAVLLASGLIEIGKAWLPAEINFRWHEVELDRRVLLFSVAATLATSVCSSVLAVVTIVPSWFAGQPLSPSTARGASSSTKTARRSRIGLIAAQVAVTAALLSTTSILGRSVLNIATAQMGFDDRQLVAVALRLPNAKYSSREMQEQFWSDIRDDVKRLPGVAQVSIGSVVPPFDGVYYNVRPASAAETSQPTEVVIAAVDTSFLSVLKVQVVSGRGFVADDSASGEAVAILDESTAAAMFHGRNAVGEQLRIEAREEAIRVVGVAADVKGFGFPYSRSPSMVYVPMSQQRAALSSTLAIRTVGDTDRVLATIKPLIARRDNAVTVRRASIVADDFATVTASPKFYMSLVGGFGIIALTLVAAGVFSLVAYVVAQRRQEFAIRAALGGSRGHIAILAVRDVALAIVIGCCTGAVLSASSSRLFAAILYDAPVRDPLAAAFATLVLIAVSAVAILLPLRKLSFERVEL